MSINQISISLDNAPGATHQIYDILETEQIHVKAILGIAAVLDAEARLVVDDTDKAIAILKAQGYKTSVEEVLAVSVPEHPGGLNVVLKILRDASVNIDVVYPFLKPAGNETVIVIKVSDVALAEAAFKKNWIKMFDHELYNM